MGRALRGWLSVTLYLGLVWGCGAAGSAIELPSASGGSRVELPWQPNAATLTERASAERARNNLAAAERFARWALKLAPEHPGALVEAARIAVGRAQGKAPREAAAELEAARRLYELVERSLASRGVSMARAGIEDERGRALLALAEAEHAHGRLEQVATLLVALDASGGTPRGRRLALHEALADAFIARGARVEGHAHTEAAARLGASADVSRVRRASLELLRDPEARRSVESALGRDAAAWARMAALAVAHAHPHAVWVATKAAELDPSPTNLAQVVMAAGHSEGAAAWLREARLAVERGGERGPAIAWACIQAMPRVVRDASVFALESAALGPPNPTALELLLYALSSAPPQDLGRLFASTFGASDRYWRSLEAAPMRWLEVVRLARAANDRGAARRAAAIGRATSPAAALLELEEALGAQAPADEITPLLAARGGDDDGISLADGDPRMRPLVTLELLASRGRLELAMPEAFGPLGPVLLEAWRLRSQGHLEQGAALLEGHAGPDAALARAHWQAPSRRVATPIHGPSALEAWRAAVSLAPDTSRTATLGLAVEALWPALKEGRLDQAAYSMVVLRWLEARGGQDARSAERALLEALAHHPRFAQEVRLALIERLAELGSPTGAAERATLVARIEPPHPGWLDDALEDAALARVRLAPQDIDFERLAEEALKGQRLEVAARLYSRLGAHELKRTEAIVDIVKLFLGRGEPERARRYANALLSDEGPGQVASGRLVALGDTLAEAGEWALSRASHQRAIDSGERSSRPTLGIVRAALRLGDDQGADQVANQWLASRPSGENRRIYDELSQLYASEGRLGRALDLIKAQGERLDANRFATAADLLKRTGRYDELESLAHEVVEGDARSGQRSHVLAVHKLLEIGRPKAALALIEKALVARPRETTLLSAALNAALAASGPKQDTSVATYARRLLTEAPATWELWVRLLDDIRAAGHGDQALEVVDVGIQRAPGQSRLLMSRGRILLWAGQGDRAVGDYAEALARADDLRAVMTSVDADLGRVWLDERLAVVTGRALALMPERADLTLSHVNALLLAGRADEAERLLGRFHADADRGHAAAANLWFRSGFFGRALDHWARGLDQLGDKEAVDAIKPVIMALTVTQSERAEVFERLYLQTFRGAKSPTLAPLGTMYTLLGQPAAALRWLERADIESPSSETALALFSFHLQRLSQGDADEGALLAHAERLVTRSAGAAQAGRAFAMVVLNELESACDKLIAAGRPDLAAALGARVERRVGTAVALRLITARALVHDGRLGDALALLDGPFPAWRGAREALPHFGRLLEDLIAAGHAEAAHGLTVRAAAAGQEREIRLMGMRVAARAGYPERAIIAARQLAYDTPAVNQWLVADALAAERMPIHAALFAREALATGLTGSSRDRATRVLGHVAGLDTALNASPRLRNDLWERAQVAAKVGLTLADSRSTQEARHLEAAHRAFLTGLSAGPIDPQNQWLALAVAGLLDADGGARVDEVLLRLMPHQTQRAKLYEDAGRELHALGLSRSASRVWAVARGFAPGHLPWAIEAAKAALAAGQPGEVAALVARGFSGVESPPVLAKLELAALAAAYGEADLAQTLAKGDGEERGARALVLAATTADDARWDDAVSRYLTHAPEESVARIHIARHVLATTAPSSTSSARARRVLEPLFESGTASQHVPELALVAALRARDLERARALFDELGTRFPGALIEAHLVLEAAFVSGSRPMVEAALARVSTGALIEVLQASPGKELGAEVVAALDAYFGAHRGAARHELALFETRDGSSTFEARVVWARARGDYRQAVKMTAAAWALVPSSERAALLHAETLAMAGESLDEAWSIAAASAAGHRGHVVETEGRLLSPSVSPRLFSTLTVLHLERGELVQARSAWRRLRVEAVPRPSATQPIRAPEGRPPFSPDVEPFLETSMGARYLELGLSLIDAQALTGPEARGFLASCVAVARAPWSGRCRAQLPRFAAP